MKKIFCSLVAAALVLSACMRPEPPGPASTPAPTAGVVDRIDNVRNDIRDALASTSMDEKIVRGLFKGFDLVLDVVDERVRRGDLVRNSPAALDLRRHLNGARSWLEAVSAARRAGNEADYRAALTQAGLALLAARRAIGGK